MFFKKSLIFFGFRQHKNLHPKRYKASVFVLNYTPSGADIRTKKGAVLKTQNSPGICFYKFIAAAYHATLKFSDVLPETTAVDLTFFDFLPRRVLIPLPVVVYFIVSVYGILKAAETSFPSGLITA